jgi:hypothetical protein
MKILQATCVGGQVFANGSIVPACEIMGEGGISSGYLLIADDKFFYLPKTTPDVKLFLTKIENLCDKIGSLCDSISAITVICSAPSSPSSTPVNSSSILLAKANILLVKTELTLLKNTLK